MRVSSSSIIEPSPTLAMNARVLEKKQQGIQVFNLSVGEAMLNVDVCVVEAVQCAIQEGKTHYAPAMGIPELRRVAAEWLNHSYGGNYSSSETMVTCGGKHGVYLALQALLDAGEGAMIIAPYWTSYPSMVRLVGGVAQIVQTKREHGWKVTTQELETAITLRTRVLIINNAANPTGVLYSAHEVEDILRFAEAHDLSVISDEVYSGLVYDGAQYISCAQFSAFKDRVCIVQSCSKNFALAGLRVGFVYGQESFIKILGDIQSQSTSGTSVISQYAAYSALQNADRIVPHIRKQIEARRNAFAENFEKLFNKKIAKPQSSLYYFLPLSLFGVSLSSDEWCRLALEDANVAMVPGNAFGVPDFVRCSFGADSGETKQGLEALARWLKKIE